MSKYLAPIHSWLYNKIQISEALESRLTSTLNISEAPFVRSLYSQVGPLLPEAPLEDLIDQGNIHGWLQNRIHMTESRLAALITELVKQDPDAIGTLKAVWHSAGETLAAGTEAPAGAKEAYQQIQDLILEGMPCDRVSQVTEAEEPAVVWLTTQCLHRQYFDAVGGDVAHYYTLREAFLNGYLAQLLPGASYTVTESPAGSGAAYINQLTIR